MFFVVILEENFLSHYYQCILLICLHLLMQFPNFALKFLMLIYPKVHLNNSKNYKYYIIIKINQIFKLFYILLYLYIKVI